MTCADETAAVLFLTWKSDNENINVMVFIVTDFVVSFNLITLHVVGRISIIF